MREAIIEGFSKYKIFEDGRIINIKKNREIKLTSISNKKHKGVYLYDDYNDVHAMGIQKLLALAFIPNPKGKYFARFKDGDSNNISLDNIAWSHTTSGEFLDDVPLQAFDKYDKTLLKEYDDIYDVEKDGFDVQSVRYCLRGRLKSHGGVIWIRKC